MPNVEITLIAALVGAILGATPTYIITHKIDGAALAQEQKAHADDMARINATAAQQLAAALAKGQAAEGHVATLTDQLNTEIAQHAKDSLDYRARLLAGTERVRVHVTGCSGSGTASQSTAPAPGTDESAAVAILSPTTSASVFEVADNADALAIQLRALQAYVTEMQNDGYINK